MSLSQTPFRIDGELTIYRAAELAAALKGAAADVAPDADLEIDLAGVSEMDSAGVQLLMATQKSLRASQRGLRLVGHSPAVVEVFATLGLTSHFGESPSPASTLR